VAVLTGILVLNAGSSSLKASVIELGQTTPAAATSVDWGSDATRAADRNAWLADALDELRGQGMDQAALLGTGHRIVHGGSRFHSPVVVDDAVMAELDGLAKFAPLHNPVAVDTLRAVRKMLPELPAVAVFDTAFHATLAPDAYVYPLPWRWYEEWGIRRYGFHGLSVEWSARRASELLGVAPEDLDVIVAHLGGGCSITAVHAGRSVSTSMGFTPLEGVAMGTRSGSVDPGILVHVLRERGITPAELAETLERESGLLGVSGVSGDVRAVEEAAEGGSSRARLALDIFIRRAAAEIAMAASALPRLDALVFTGGIGEHASEIRASICDRLSVLGIRRAEDDQIAAGDAVISQQGLRPAVLRVAAREDLVISEAVHTVLSPTG
jgi:acetate kinase